MVSYDYIVKFALTMRRLKMFPMFEAAHYILMCSAVREANYTPRITTIQSPGEKKILFSRLHPLASYVGSLLMCFAGSILGNFVMGEPIISPFQNTRDVLFASLVWYLINYSPFDVVYKTCSLAPIKMFINILKEVRRANKIDQGLHYALKVLPDSYIVASVFAILKGTASSHMKVFQRLICGSWQPSSIELLNPSLSTKACTLGTIFLLLTIKGFVQVSQSLVYLSIVLMFLITRIFQYFSIDPFRPFENLISCILMGGVMDSLKIAMLIARGNRSEKDDMRNGVVKNKKDD